MAKRPIDYDGTWHKFIVDHYKTGEVNKTDIIKLLESGRDIPGDASKILIGLIEGTIKQKPGKPPLSFEKQVELVGKYVEIKRELEKKGTRLLDGTPREMAIEKLGEEFEISDRNVAYYIAKNRELMVFYEGISPEAYPVSMEFLKSEMRAGKMPETLREFNNYIKNKELKN
jgi:hypothetical protein